MSRRGTVIQVPPNRIALCRTPLCIVVLIFGVCGIETRNRRAAETRVVVPALEVVTGSRCRLQRDRRIQYRIRTHRVRIGCGMPCGRSVIQCIRDGIAVCTAPLCIKGLGRGIHRREAVDWRTREARIVIPAPEGIAVSKRGHHVDIAAAVCEHRVAREIRGRVGRRVPCGRAVIQHVGDRVGNRRGIPLRIVALILRVQGAEGRYRCSREARVIVPTEEGIAGSSRRTYGDIRIQNGIACSRVRVACRMSRRCTVIQIPLHRIRLCGTPLCIVLLIRGIRSAKRRDRRTAERGIVIPAEEIVTGSDGGLQGKIRIQDAITRHGIRIACRVSGGCTVI